MKRVFVGTYELGYERVRLYLRDGSGAGTQFIPADKGLTAMEIGADQDKWRKVVASLLHEAQEAAMCRLGLSFYPYGSLNSSTANCMFMMNHEQFDECCARAAEMIASVLPELSRAWEKWKTPKIKKKVVYVKFKVACPQCHQPDKKILVSRGKRTNHYRCDHCGHDFESWRGFKPKVKK